ncbi:MAG TPA: nucleoside 2-deoxyribosyltransferase [Acetobacteraceae bacterium]|nr:nucleoside 2-deoxyribosyltransferase [Acetobacteraceae bacterium]
MTRIVAYLAGPDVFLPDAPAHARRKVAICARHGITGRPPLNEDIASLRTLPSEAAWRAIFRKDLAMMEACGHRQVGGLPGRTGPGSRAG